MDDLQHTLKGAGAVWLPGWAGYMGTLDTFLILISLAFTALGIGAAWKKIGPAGIMPLVIFLGYNLATAIARTSGGRYLVPVDWVVILYFGIGLALSIRWVTGALGFSREDQITKDEAPQLVPTRLPWKGGFMVAACFLLIGGAIPFAEKIVTPMYTINKLDQTLEQVQLEKLLEPYGVGEKDLQDYLKSEKRIIGYGRLLYPRFYRANEGEPDIYSANKGLPFPRLIFNVVGGKSGSFVLPLSEVPGPLTPGSSVLVLGCSKSRWYADALQLIILGPEPKVLTRSPAATLTCPVEQPICDNNGNCQ
jgi:hypothetical protein